MAKRWAPPTPTNTTQSPKPVKWIYHCEPHATTHESGRVLRRPDEAPQLTNLERQETDATTLTLHGEIIQKILWNQTRQAQNRHRR